jgi:hypothetical protein
MAGFYLHATSGEIATYNGNKTMLQVQAAANDRVRISGWTASFKGTSATDAPVLVQLLRQTTAGTGLQTGVSGTNISKKNVDDSATIQTAVLFGAASGANTGEPTASDILDTQEVHPQTGVRIFYPSGQELYLTNSQRLGIRILDTMAHTCVVDADIEE